MKRLLIALFLCLFAFNAFKASAWNPNFACPGGGAAAIVDNCPNATYELAWTGDNTSGADYWCYANGTASVQGSIDATIVINSTSIAISETDSGLYVDPSGKISAGTVSVGTLFFTVKNDDNALNGDDDIDTSLFFEMNDNSDSVADNQIRCEFNGGNTCVSCIYIGATAIQAANWIPTSIDTIYRCGYSWDVPNDIHSVQCVTSGSVPWDGNAQDDSEDLTPWEAEHVPVVFRIGELNTGQAMVDQSLVYDLYIMPGYKQADPGSL